ncbi:hypothetical protein Lal_00039771 [Lupinus albus]|nr:hypothetical protein Lal_00039771 [Lupinus albus]
MASSSRTKKPQTSVSQSKQGTSSSKSNPLNLTRLLANDEQWKEKSYYFPCERKRYCLDAKTLSSLCCDIPTQGSKNVCDCDNYDRKELYISLCRISKEEIEQRKQQGFGETVKNRDILSVGYLKLEDRLLHYFLSYVVLPKFSNHSQISDIELQLMYAMKFNIKINWTQMIMQQMWNVRGSQSPLPYAIFITKILEHFGVSLDGETKLSDCRTYKHRTDRLTAPTAQPEPTITNPPEFHAQSSSSVAMPSNQMIMDELVSLRGYFTNRMDSLDTQNKKIQYELDRLSSSLNSTKVDEDSSDPES